jgi:hypothetical protein
MTKTINPSGPSKIEDMSYTASEPFPAGLDVGHGSHCLIINGPEILG